MALVVAPERKQVADRSRYLELALNRERQARSDAEKELRSRNHRLEQENAELRALLEDEKVQVQVKEAAINEANEATDSARRAKSSFLSIISHELRTPLNAIIGYSELLSDDAKESGQEHLLSDLQTIHGAGRHLLELINDALYLSKIDVGNVDLTWLETDLNVIVNDLEQAVFPLMERNGNKLSLKVSADLGVFYTDPVRLKKILQTLLANAAKFTHSGEVNLSVGRAMLKGQHIIEFKVQDSGIGMSEAELARVFIEFEQADTSFSRRFQGAGLGLTVAKRLCCLMDGDITVSSVKGEGSIFTAYLPCGSVQK